MAERELHFQRSMWAEGGGAALVSAAINRKWVTEQLC